MVSSSLLRNLIAVLAVAVLGADDHVPSVPSCGQRVAAVLARVGTGGRYDEVPQVTIHNAYAERTTVREQLERAGVRSLELDVHTSKRGRPKMAGDWYVYHHDFPWLDDSRCERLSECLDELAAFHASTPRHAAVTLFVDVKDVFAPGHAPEDLDALMRERLGAGNVFAPAELMRACSQASSLRQAVTAPCGWPTRDELEGKFIVALTGASACPSSILHPYAPDELRASARLAFVAPSVVDDCDIDTYLREAPFVVFFNLDWAHRHLAPLVRALGGVTRLYSGNVGGALDDDQLLTALAEPITFLATDRLRFP
jgi:hypothetical protein